MIALLLALVLLLTACNAPRLTTDSYPTPRPTPTFDTGVDYNKPTRYDGCDRNAVARPSAVAEYDAIRNTIGNEYAQLRAAFDAKYGPCEWRAQQSRGIATMEAEDARSDREMGWVPIRNGLCPSDHLIKANPDSMVYHMPSNDSSYTRLENPRVRCYASTAAAERHGFRHAAN